jgi:site-specific DNA recombinase
VKAIGYFREGARRNGRNRSVGEQHQSFLEFCSTHGYEVAATFLDTTGDKEADDGYQQMLRYLRRGDHGFMVAVVDCVGALAPDLGRAALRALTIEAAGVQLFEAEHADEAAKQIIQQWAGRGEGTPVSEKVRSAMRRKAVRGEALGRPPYGYHVGARQRLEVVSEESLVVKYIYRLYLHEGLGIRRIAGRLNDEEVRTRRGGRWSMVTVRDILRNRVYLGTYTRFGVRIPDSHQRLVANDDFKRVQEIMHQRNRSGTARTVRPYLLSGLVTCARCWNRMIGVSRRQKWTTKGGEERSASYRYYQCESRTNQNSCGYNTQRAAELEAKVRELLTEGGNAVSTMQRAGNIDSYTLDLMSQMERLDGQVRRNQRQVEELVGDAAHGHISLERMRTVGTGLISEHESLDDQRRERKQRLDAQASEEERQQHLTETRERVVRSWDKLEFPELQQKLRELVDRIEVDGDEIRLFLRP